jgi:hypothetical protein
MKRLSYKDLKGLLKKELKWIDKNWKMMKMNVLEGKKC